MGIPLARWFAGGLFLRSADRHGQREGQQFNNSPPVVSQVGGLGGCPWATALGQAPPAA